MLFMSLLVAFAMFGQGLAIERVVHTELKESVVQDLLKCINLLPTSYKAYVEADGHVVIIPVERRAIDLAGIDKGLATCMKEVLGEMTVKAESSEFEDSSHQSAQATGSVDFAFLLENGAKGQTTQPGIDAAAEAFVNATAVGGTALGRRVGPACVYYYGAYPDIYTGCANADYVLSYYTTCVNKSSKYVSIQFYNANICNRILVSIWPHHNCLQGNQQSYYVAAGTTSTCNNRDTFSYNGVQA